MAAVSAASSSTTSLSSANADADPNPSSLSPDDSKTLSQSTETSTKSPSLPLPDEEEVLEENDLSASPIATVATAAAVPTTFSRSSPSLEPSSGTPTLLYVSFNQDYACFATGTDRGFSIYNCDPFCGIYRRDFDGGGIGVVEMLFRCNVMALVGGGSQPYFQPNKVMIWDDHQGRCMGELSYRSEVRGVRLRRDRIVVILDSRIFVYNYDDLKLVHQIDTFPNPKGLCAVSQQKGSLVLVCPGGQKGQVRVEHYDARKTKFIMTHDSGIACFGLSQDGRLIATASTKGTLIRIFSTMDGTLLQEVRRGADRAEIYSLAFSPNMQWLAASSDKGTIHVFNLKVNLGLTVNDKPRPAQEPNVPAMNLPFSFIKSVLPKYFHSEWSVAQFRLPEGGQYVVGFGHQKNTVVILGMDGSFYRCEFDPESGGEMKQLECHNFLRPDQNS